jgi:hypothetical protein
MAFEYYKARQGVSAITTDACGTDSLGLGTLPSLRGRPDNQMGILHAKPVVFGRAAAGVSTASHVQAVWSDVLGRVGPAGAGQLVRSGSAPGSH